MSNDVHEPVTWTVSVALSTGEVTEHTIIQTTDREKLLEKVELFSAQIINSLVRGQSEAIHLINPSITYNRAYVVYVQSKFIDPEGYDIQDELYRFISEG